MSDPLMKAILAMDSYNRGYDPGIKFGNLANGDSIDARGTKIGNAIIYDSRGDTAAKNVSFYAVAYNYGGETVISYRGTDNPGGLNGDVINGWLIGGGQAVLNHADLAFKIYQSVANSAYFANGDWDAPQVTISLTGHSLGGGI